MLALLQSRDIIVDCVVTDSGCLLFDCVTAQSTVEHFGFVRGPCWYGDSRVQWSFRGSPAGSFTTNSSWIAGDGFSMLQEFHGQRVACCSSSPQFSRERASPVQSTFVSCDEQQIMDSAMTETDCHGSPCIMTFHGVVAAVRWRATCVRRSTRETALGWWNCCWRVCPQGHIF